MGVIGPRSTAVSVKEKIAKFLKDDLKVELNEEKTKITKISDETFNFLGYKIKAISRKNYRSLRVKGKYAKTRAALGGIRLYIPTEKIVERLEQKNLAKEGRGIKYGP